jgi:thioredoxin 1
MVLSLNERSFKQEVLESTTPVLVNFWAPWCGICFLINPILKGFEAEWGDRVKIVGINADQSLKLASTYRIATLPTLIWFESGSMIHRIEGFQGRDDLSQELRSLILQTQMAQPYSQLQSAINS